MKTPDSESYLYFKFNFHMKFPASIFFLFLAQCALAQVDTSGSSFGSYFFDEDDVVFEFDRRDYEKAYQASNGKMVDFADINISKVTVSGNFNNWSEQGWKMKRIDNDRFQLRKRLSDFKDKPNWQFRFLINGAYLVAADRVPKVRGEIEKYDIKNPNAPRPTVSDTGNVRFFLKGYNNAKQVILTGSFNEWDEHAIQMKRVTGGWEIHLSLKPGEYEYKFIADGNWTEDPDNPSKRHNQYMTWNSVLHVSGIVHFQLNGYKEARQVMLAGTFNHWNPNDLKMTRNATGWGLDIQLVGGKHLYKFIIDGNWITDPVNRRTEVDLEGNRNSVLFVK